jgi:hypothetical protein
VRRALLASLASLSLLLVGSLALVSWATRDERGASPGSPPPPEVAERAPPAEEAEPGPSAAAESAIPPAAASVPRPPPASVSAPRVASAPPPSRLFSKPVTGTTLKSTVPTRLQRHRVSFRMELISALAALQREVARCAVGATASFLLDVETVQGGVRILAAEPASGAIDAAGAACVQSVLRGRVVPVPTAEPGRQWQMALAVSSAL